MFVRMLRKERKLEVWKVLVMNRVREVMIDILENSMVLFII